jgi:hypothetical protein
LYLSFLLWVLLGVQIRLQPVPPSSGTPNAPGADAKPSTVRGKVLAADTGTPVARAQVTLRRNGVGSSAFSTTTDASGLYEIRNVDPGTYSGVASKSGYLNTFMRQRMLNLGEDQEAKDVDFLMPRAGVITGTVLDDHDEPIPGVNVQAMMKTYNQGRMQLQQRGVSAPTDDRGQYRIHDLPAGRYYVQAVKHNGPDPAPHYATVLYPSVSRLADALPIKVTGGEEVSSIKFQMHESAVFSINGRVMDSASGQPAAGAFVYIGPEDYSAGGSSVNTTAAADGTFRLTEVTPGTYRLAANQRLPAGNANAGQVYNAVRTVQVSDRNIANLTINIGPGTTVRGRVVAVGADLPSAERIQLLGRSSNGNINSSTPPVTSQADGSFEIPNVQPGNYEVTVMPQFSNNMGFNNPGMGHAYFFTSAVTVGNQDVTDTGINVPEEAPSLDVQVTLDSRSGTVTGTTFDGDNNPLPAVNIAMFSADPKKRESLRYFSRGRSDTQGAFHLTAVIPGEYLMVLWPGDDPGMIADPDIADAIEKYCVRVSVGPSSTVNQDLKLNSDVQTIVRGLAQN